MAARLRFIQMAQAKGWAALALACLVLLGDTSGRRSAATVAFLGAGDARVDPVFLNFEKAMQRWARPGSSPHILRYHRIADADPQGIARDVAQVMASRPSIVVAPTGDSALAAVRHEVTPLVFASYPDPVHFGIVPSMKAPGRGITGVSLADDLHAKRLELLRDAYPAIRSVGVLADRSWWRGFQGHAVFRDAAARQGLGLRVVLADTLEELNTEMQTLGGPGPDAWYVPATYLAYFAEAAILRHLQRLGRPSMHTTLGEVARGAPLAYVQDTSFVFDAMADLTHRVLRGVDAGSIPVQSPRQFVLAVRPRDEPAALRMNPSVVRRADRVY